MPISLTPITRTSTSTNNHKNTKTQIKYYFTILNPARSKCLSNPNTSFIPNLSIIAKLTQSVKDNPLQSLKNQSTFSLELHHLFHCSLQLIIIPIFRIFLIIALLGFIFHLNIGHDSFFVNILAAWQQPFSNRHM